MKDSRWQEILSGSGQRPTYGELIDEIRRLRADIQWYKDHSDYEGVMALKAEVEQLEKQLEEAGRVTLELAIPNKNTTWHCFQDANNNPIMEQLHCDSCDELKAEVEQLKVELKECNEGFADQNKRWGECIDKLATHEEAMIGRFQK